MKYYGKMKFATSPESYECPLFAPYIYRSHDWNSCGSPIIAMVTGEHPATVERHKPTNQRHWSNTALVKYLRKKKINVEEVTVQGVTQTYWESYPLNDNHILVANLHLDSKEASWFLIHKGVIWHNQYEVQGPSKLLFFVNKPPQNVFLVWHEKWA